jgi:hypothetical protein
LKNRYDSVETIETISDASDDESKNSDYTKKLLLLCAYDLSMLTNLDCHGELGENNHNESKRNKRSSMGGKVQVQDETDGHHIQSNLEFQHKKFGFTSETAEDNGVQSIKEIFKIIHYEKPESVSHNEKLIDIIKDEESRVKSEESNIKVKTNNIFSINYESSDHEFNNKFIIFKNNHRELDEEQICNIRALLLCNYLQFDKFTILNDRVILHEPIGRAYGDFIKNRGRKYISACNGLQFGISRIYIKDLYNEC